MHDILETYTYSSYRPSNFLIKINKTLAYLFLYNWKVCFLCLLNFIFMKTKVALREKGHRTTYSARINILGKISVFLRI